MAAQITCSQIGCSAPMTHRQVSNEAPLCAQHVAVELSMLDSAYSAREGDMVFGRYAELLLAVNDRRIIPDARETVLAKLDGAAIDLGVWLLTKVHSPAEISIPEQNELSEQFIRAVKFATDAGVKLAQTRQMSMQNQNAAGNDFLNAMNGVWALIREMVLRLNRAQTVALTQPRVSFTYMVVALMRQLTGNEDPITNPIQLARTAGAEIDAAFK